MTKIIAITGGIGSGKSVVARMLSVLGYEVYDCDSKAKLLMDESVAIKQRLAREIGQQVIVDNEIDRKRLAEIVFSDAQKLEILNSIVHDEVRNDILKWRNRIESPRPAFVETAILYQSGLDKMVDEVWEVVAPIEVRIERVMNRNSMTRSQVISRINAQESFIPDRRHESVVQIVNDGATAILPILLELLK